LTTLLSVLFLKNAETTFFRKVKRKITILRVSFSVMNTNDFLDTNITYLPGVGPKRAELLGKEVSIFTYRDLLYYFPFKYIDKSRFYKVEELESEMPYVQIKGFITRYYTEGVGKNKRLAADLKDETGIIKLVWFKGLKWITSTYPVGIEYIVFGKPSVFNGIINIVHPEIEATGKAAEKINSALQAQYSVTEKLKDYFIASKAFNKFVGTLFKLLTFRLSETLPEYLVKKYNLMGLHDSLLNIHFPSSPNELEKARYRLKFEELFYIQLPQGRLMLSILNL
jgi:ATP-dependent DNA helicase RecG